jgi:SEC-C motif-containing protein
MAVCFCGSKKEFSQCCDPYIKGNAVAPTAEALMRARYSAFASGSVEFIKKTVLPSSLAEYDENATREWSLKSKWLGFEILNMTGGKENDTEGVVEFVAAYSVKDAAMKHHEIAKFKKENGTWYFCDGTIVQPKPFIREEPKTGRNDPCPCGSGKKFKKCCENKQPDKK